MRTSAAWREYIEARVQQRAEAIITRKKTYPWSWGDNTIRAAIDATLVVAIN